MGRDPVRTGWTLRLLTFLLVPALLLSAAVLSGCSYTQEEPGLFGRSPEPTTLAPSPVATTSTTASSPRGDLPVVGQAVWTSGDGTDVQLRYAVHAVRRLRGATVLDWSITPLGGRGLSAGDALPPFVELGLGPGSDDLGIFLVDDFGGSVYRPLSAEPVGSRPGCLCTPLGQAQGQLRIGQTRLLQIAYPALPADLASVDVDIQTVPMIYHVPVTGEGEVPRMANPVDLTAAADGPSVGPSSTVFSYGPRHQKLLLSVDVVLASGTFTSVRWTIQSVTAGPGVASAGEPPLVDRAIAARSVNPVAASGLRLRPVGGALGTARRMRVSGAGKELVQCLCTDLRQWTTSLKRESRSVSVVTNLEALPIGTQRVDVVFPGLRTVRLDVTVAPDSSTQSAGSVGAKSRTWPRGQGWPSGWSVDDWPTPLPPSSEVSHYAATVERLLP